VFDGKAIVCWLPRNLLAIALLLTILLPTSRAQAVMFDCKKGSSFVEKVICSDSRLSSMDDQVGRLYKEALAKSSDDDAVRDEQKAWLKSRNQCKDSDCIMKAYTDRISALSAMNAPAKAGDFTGTYKMKDDGAAGEALIQQTGNDRIKFYLNATYRMNTGELSGEIPLSGDAATYVDKEFDCTVSFDFAHGSLILIQNGSCGMGLNVDAAGTYKRVSSAPPKFPE
jgi:uncharacterized protein